MPKKTAKEPQNWKRIWQMIRPYRGWMIASMVLAAFTVAFTLYIPILVGDAIDAMVEAGKVSFAIITPILWKIAILAVLTALFQWIMQTMHNKITYQVVRDFRTAAFEKIQKLPLSYLDRHPTGETVSRVITDVDQFADGLLMGFTQLFTGVFTLIGTLLFMLVLDWKISLVVILMTPLSILFAKSLSGHIYKMFRAQSEARAEQTAMVNEAIGNQKVIQAFHHEEVSGKQQKVAGNFAPCIVLFFFGQSGNTVYLCGCLCSGWLDRGTFCFERKNYCWRIVLFLELHQPVYQAV